MRRCRRSRTVHVSCDRDMVGEAVVWRITRNAYFREAGAALSGAPPIRLNCATMGTTGEKDNAPLWGGRFGSSPAEAFERLNASIPFDVRLAPHDIRGSIAHAKMLGEQGIVTETEAAELVRGLEVVLGEVESGEFAWTISDEDVHTAVERRLREHIGGGALKLHTGRSRNDQGGLDPHPFLLAAAGGTRGGGGAWGGGRSRCARAAAATTRWPSTCTSSSWRRPKAYAGACSRRCGRSSRWPRPTGRWSRQATR